MLHTVCRMLISVWIRGFFIFFSKNNTPSIAHPVDMHWAFFFISIENGQKNNNKKVTNSKRRNKGKHCMNFDQLIVVVDFVGSKHRRRLVKHQKKILKKAFNKTSVIRSTSDCITTLRRQLYTNKVKQLRSRDRGERENTNTDWDPFAKEVGPATQHCIRAVRKKKIEWLYEEEKTSQEWANIDNRGR